MCTIRNFDRNFIGLIRSVIYHLVRLTLHPCCYIVSTIIIKLNALQIDFCTDLRRNRKDVVQHQLLTRSGQQRFPFLIDFNRVGYFFLAAFHIIILLFHIGIFARHECIRFCYFIAPVPCGFVGILFGRILTDVIPVVIRDFD